MNICKAIYHKVGDKHIQGCNGLIKATKTRLTRTNKMIPSFRREVNDSRDVLGYYAASSGNSLPKFRDNPSVPSSGDKNPRRFLYS
jgi:hypothetical protein